MSWGRGRGRGMLFFPLVLMTRLNKTESAVFFYCRFGDPFSRLFRDLRQLSLYCVELVKLLHVHQYSVDIFQYSGLSGLLCSDGVGVDALSISSHDQIQ